MQKLEERLMTFQSSVWPYILQPNGDRVFDWLQERGFFTAPASTKYHGAYEGGLFDHSYNVVKSLERLTVNMNLQWERRESPYIIGIFHDLCKIDQYRQAAPSDEATRKDGKPFAPAWEYNDQTLLKGHGDKSVMLLSQLMPLTEEEIACIRYHMGAFCAKEEWSDYTRAIHRFPNVLWTHTADMMAAHIMEV